MHIAAVIAAVIQALRTALPDSLVVYGKRGTITVTGDRVIFVGEAKGRAEDPVLGDEIQALGYDIDITYSVTRHDPDGQLAAATDVIAMWAAGVQALRVVTVPGVMSIRPTGQWRLVPAAPARAREAAVASIVQVREDY